MQSHIKVILILGQFKKKKRERETCDHKMREKSQGKNRRYKYFN